SSTKRKQRSDLRFRCASLLQEDMDRTRINARAGVGIRQGNGGLWVIDKGVVRGTREGGCRRRDVHQKARRRLRAVPRLVGDADDELMWALAQSRARTQNTGGGRGADGKCPGDVSSVQFHLQ